MNCVIKIGAVMWMMSISKCMPIPEEREKGKGKGKKEERREKERRRKGRKKHTKLFKH